MSVRTGRVQAAVLARMAASPAGLTAADMAALPDLAATSDPRPRAGAVARRLAKRGMVTRAGYRPTRAQPAAVWAITRAGREELARITAAAARKTSAQKRLDRRNAVAAAIAAGSGPQTPEGERKERALAMRAAGCGNREVALAFAVPERHIARWIGGRHEAR